MVVEAIRNEILDKLLNGVDFATDVAEVSLHTDDPGTTGANEASGGSYARQAISFVSPPTGGQGVSSNQQTFADMPAGAYSHLGFWTAGGTFVWPGALTETKTIDAGDTIEFDAGDITAPTTGA